MEWVAHQFIISLQPKGKLRKKIKMGILMKAFMCLCLLLFCSYIKASARDNPISRRIRGPSGNSSIHYLLVIFFNISIHYTYIYT